MMTSSVDITHILILRFARFAGQIYISEIQGKKNTEYIFWSILRNTKYCSSDTGLVTYIVMITVGWRFSP